jgi:hypothetical protein
MLFRILKRFIPAGIKSQIRTALCPKSQKLFDMESDIAIKNIRAFEVAFRVNTADEDVIAENFENDLFFQRVPEYQPRDGGTIFDIGAHIGTFSLLAQQETRTGIAHAIEACKGTFNLLKINAALNKCERIRVHHLAVSDRDGSGLLYHDSGNWGHSTVCKLSVSQEAVSTISLCSFFE